MKLERIPSIRLIALAAVVATVSGVCASATAGQLDSSQIPRLVHENGRYALFVDGAPYLYLGAQSHNSSALAGDAPQGLASNGIPPRQHAGNARLLGTVRAGTGQVRHDGHRYPAQRSPRASHPAHAPLVSAHGRTAARITCRCGPRPSRRSSRGSLARTAAASIRPRRTRRRRWRPTCMPSPPS